MEQLTVYSSLDQARQAINGAHHKAMTSFIELGYIFRQVGDNKLFEQGGYSSLADFAKQEYNYSQAQVSRFISLNMEFSVDGNSTVLADKYEAYSQTKLVEMLQIPEEVRDLIDPETKRDDIRDLRKDLEDADEQAKEETFTAAITGQPTGDPLETHIIDLIIEIKDRWPEIYKQINDTGSTNDIKVAFTTSGAGFKRAGSAMFFFRKDEVVVKAGADQIPYEYSDLIDVLKKKYIADPVIDTEGSVYEQLTGEEYEEEKPAAYVENADSKKNTAAVDAVKANIEKRKAQTEKKPEVEHTREEKTEDKNPLPEPTDPEPSVDTETPAEPEAQTDVEIEVVDDIENHECKLLSPITTGVGKDSIIIKGRTMRVYDAPPSYPDKKTIATFAVMYCPVCGKKLS